MGAERASIFVYHARANQLACIIADGIRLQDPTRLQLDEAEPSLLGVAGASAKERRTINIADAYSDERFDRSTDTDGCPCTCTHAHAHAHAHAHT